jgi:hypothetical protein
VDSFCAGFNRALSFAVPRISTLRQPRHRGRTPKQDEGSLRQDRARHEFCPEKIMQDHQRQSPPAHRQMLEWRRATHGSASLIRAIPSRLLEPECKDRSSRAVAIERCPQSTNCLLEANKAAWVTSDDPTDLTLELEDTNGEIRLRWTLLPSPAGQNGVALATAVKRHELCPKVGDGLK